MDELLSSMQYVTLMSNAVLILTLKKHKLQYAYARAAEVYKFYEQSSKIVSFFVSRTQIHFLTNQIFSRV